MVPAINYSLWREGEDLSPEVALQRLRDIDSQRPQIRDSRQKATLLLNKGVLNGVLKRGDIARQCFEEALKVCQGDSDIRMAGEFLAAALEDQERGPVESLQILTQVLKRFKDRLMQEDALPVYADLQQRRALNLICIERFEEAIPLLEECLRVNRVWQSQGIVIYNIGYCYFCLERYESAIAYLLKTIAADVSTPWKGKAHVFLGASYFKLGRLREAKEELLLCEKNSIEYQVPIEQVYEALAGISWGLGDRLAAETYTRLRNEV